MGCLDPTNPPAAIAPEHPKGTTCRVQRCPGCRHGVVFQDSLETLAKCYAELIILKGQLAFAAWKGSSFEEEEQALDETLASFEAGAVKSAIDAWLERFRKGEAVLHDVYPTY